MNATPSIASQTTLIWLSGAEVVALFLLFFIGEGFIHHFLVKPKLKMTWSKEVFGVREPDSFGSSGITIRRGETCFSACAVFFRITNHGLLAGAAKNCEVCNILSFGTKI